MWIQMERWREKDVNRRHDKITEFSPGLFLRQEIQDEIQE